MTIPPDSESDLLGTVCGTNTASDNGPPSVVDSKNNLDVDNDRFLDDRIRASNERLLDDQLRASNYLIERVNQMRAQAEASDRARAEERAEFLAYNKQAEADAQLAKANAAFCAFAPLHDGRHKHCTAAAANSAAHLDIIVRLLLDAGHWCTRHI